jgi:hypothetical protein
MTTERADLRATRSWLVRRTAFLRTRPGIDWLVALALAAIVWLMGYHGKQLVDLLDAVGRRATYQSLAVLSGAMMGLSHQGRFDPGQPREADRRDSQ